MWLPVEAVVAEALNDVAAKKVISIPSVRYRLLIVLARHVPRSVVRAASARMVMSRRRSK
jgi:short-subunit dehydrogenase